MCVFSFTSDAIDGDLQRHRGGDVQQLLLQRREHTRFDFGVELTHGHNVVRTIVDVLIIDDELVQARLARDRGRADRTQE